MDSNNLERKRIGLGSYILFLTFFIAPFVGLIVAIISTWNSGVDWYYLAIFATMYLITAFGTTGGYHRLFTHESYYAKPWVKLLIGIAGSMAVQGKIYTWCSLHRVHHQNSDKPGDPHSPVLPGDSVLTMIKGLWHAQIGWMFMDYRIEENTFTRNLKNDPIVTFIDRYIILWVALGGIIPAILGYFHDGIKGIFLGFVWGGLVRIFFHQHVTSAVNSICHVFGKRRYNTGDKSTDNWLIAILALGEGFHNGHHAFQKSALHGVDTTYLDSTYITLRVMESLGMIEIHKNFIPNDDLKSGRLNQK